jgi:phosphatidylglycerol:prolipoprotein diacylglycerol transferase
LTVARRKDRTRSSRNADAGRGSTSAAKTPTLSGGQPNLVVTQVQDNASVEAEALVVSHWFDPGEAGEPYPATIRLSGRRADVAGRPGPADAFVHEEIIERVVPGTGPISISSWVYGLKPGDWTVSGELVKANRAAGRVVVKHAEPLASAAWSWRHWSIRTAPPAPIKTRWALAAPLARIPGVLPGSYTVLFAAGLVVALASQMAILASEQIAVPRSIFVTLLALSAGLLGAKLWSTALHPGESLLKGGWAVDGFLVTAPLVAIVALVAFGLPVGAYLDATAPGLFFAVAIGRIGCFLTGCCAGRVTSSRWAIWSSDRRIGARRIPTQLLESGAGLLIGSAALPLTLLHLRAVHGAVFVVGFAAYFVVRQMLLRLREEARRYSWQRNRLVPDQM